MTDLGVAQEVALLRARRREERLDMTDTKDDKKDSIIEVDTTGARTIYTDEDGLFHAEDLVNPNPPVRGGHAFQCVLHGAPPHTSAWGVTFDGDGCVTLTRVGSERIPKPIQINAASVDPATEFHELTIELCRRYTHVKHAIRAQALVVAALAMVDASSIEMRKGARATEAEFLELCRRFFRKVRGT